ncbi:MAG: DUF167 domain-containing protein [Candidatus Bathyarchaeia archaeon]
MRRWYAYAPSVEWCQINGAREAAEKRDQTALRAGWHTYNPCRCTPVRGKANREIVRWLSKRLRTSSSNVQLVAGFHSNVKVIEITGMTEAEIAAVLGIKCKSDAGG